MTTIAAPIHLQLSDRSWLLHHPGWLTNADEALAALPGELTWKQEPVTMFGKATLQPRLTAVCGKSMVPSTRYTRANPDTPWTPTTTHILNRLTPELRTWKPNGLIANWYRDGGDAIGWHSDNEKALGPAPTVVSVSLGATRNFDLRRIAETTRLLRLELGHGDLLIMGPHVQHEFAHSIARTKTVTRARISLTFRRYESAK
jgi:alkylated DNA repair dioxygenase AlkB